MASGCRPHPGPGPGVLPLFPHSQEPPHRGDFQVGGAGAGRAGSGAQSRVARSPPGSRSGDAGLRLFHRRQPAQLRARHRPWSGAGKGVVHRDRRGLGPGRPGRRRASRHGPGQALRAGAPRAMAQGLRDHDRQGRSGAGGHRQVLGSPATLPHRDAVVHPARDEDLVRQDGPRAYPGVLYPPGAAVAGGHPPTHEPGAGAAGAVPV